jgi:hypothetical protein
MLRNLNTSTGGKRILGTPKTGVLGSLIPSTGDNGAGYCYNDLVFPTDNAKEIRGQILTWPSAGTLTAYEDTSFEFSAPDGVYYFTYQLYVDGVSVGSPATVTLVVGYITHTTSGNLVASSASLSGTASRSVVVVSHSATGALTASAATLAGFSYIGDFPVSLSHFISRQSARNFSSLSTRKTYVSTKKRP